MLFSSPDYPVFLIAVFFLYALARGTGPIPALARGAIMLLLGDLVFLLIAKDVTHLWDPLGGLAFRLVVASAADAPTPGEWGAMIAQWLVGGAVLAGAIWIGRHRGDWIASARGQQRIALGFVAIVAIVGAALVAAHVASPAEGIAALTAVLARGGHLIVLGVLGVAIGAAQREARAQRVLARVLVLFVVSCLFYHAWAAAMPGAYRYLLALLLATITLDYYLGIWLEDARGKLHRGLLLAASVCSNLGVLFFFKYYDFASQDVLHLPVSPLHLLLPAGISFHTFQSLSYTVDVYRGELRATRSVIEFATFVLFFPQLVAGPIVRAQDLLPQLANPPELELASATRGLFRILCGLFKKIALADPLAVDLVDRVFANPERYSSIETLAGVYGYALQIYLDFSAYSDIAIGSAQVLGFTLPENFRTPYRSANLQEFWRRWHISLSTWLRDYLYITLGGSRGAPWRTYVNLAATMLLGGLWHGANWTFIVWGGLHGLGLAVTRYFQRALTASPAMPSAIAAPAGQAPRSAAPPRAQSALALFAACVAFAAIGGAVHYVQLADASTWTQLIAAWLYLTPLWAFATAWLGGELPASAREPGTGTSQAALGLRIAMCVVGAGFFAALAYGPSWLWLPLAEVAWCLALAADGCERSGELPAILWPLAKRLLSALLTFHYVCLAWIFFRAPTFDDALAVLRRLAAREWDAPNLVPLVTTALVVGALCHLWADGALRWLRDRFTSAPAIVQGLVLAAAMVALRALSHTQIVPFIYFQF